MNNKNKFYLLFGVLALTALTAFGQRFHKAYPQAGGFLVPDRGVEVPGGFSIGLDSREIPPFYLDMHLDSAGHFLSLTDSVFFAAHFTPAKFIRTADGGAISFSTESSDSVRVARIDALGNTVWLRSYPFPIIQAAISTSGGFQAAVENPDGFYLIGKVTAQNNTGGESRFLAAKVGLDGALVWMTTSFLQSAGEVFQTDPIVNGNHIYFQWNHPFADPGYVFVGKISTTGVWEDLSESGASFNGTTDFALHPAGGYVAIGYSYSFFQPSDQFGQAQAIGPDGQTIWSHPTGWPQLDALCDFNLGGSYVPLRIVPTNEGWLIAGEVRPTSLDPTRAFLAKLNSSGNITALNTYAVPLGGSLYQAGLSATLDGGCLLTYYSGNNNTYRTTVLKTDSLLVATPNLITGNIFQDQNLSCQRDTGEAGVPRWFVQLIHGQDSTYTTADLLGAYSFPADTGAYLLKIRPFNPYWEACTNTQNVLFLTENTTQNADFALQAIQNCPQMEVDIAIPRLRRCINNPMYVRYCNNGTVPAANTLVRVALDPTMEFIASSIPLTGQSGDTLFFAVGTVGVNDCGSFSLTVKPNCDNTVDGQTLCVEAHISPDTFCVELPSWSGAQIEAGGICGQDSVTFWLKNTGTAVSQMLDYIVIEDIVVWRTGNFQLAPGETDTIRAPITGATWRIEADQEPGYPLPGMPTAWVEGCGWNGVLPFPGGFVTQFPDEDGNPAVSTDCRMITGSYDPNDKQASPSGADVAHYILPGTPIEYLIRFQNTGNDTAFQVVIKDKLATWLDPMSVQLGATSHPCRLELVENGVLKFIFDNILLPDSTTNLAASQGFARFRVLPRANTPLGTRIENTAAIYFDFNQPIHTNMTWHTVDTSFLQKITDPVHTPPTEKLSSIALSPNPARAGDWVYFLKNKTMNGLLTLSDCAGVRVASLRVDAGRMQLPLGLLPGVYFWEMANGGRGKMVVF